MKKLLLASIAAAMATGAYAQFESGSEYYIRNVETGLYLTNGHSWGTLGVTRESGREFQLIEKDGGYMLKSSVGVAKHEGSELWIDGNEGNNVVMTFTKQDDGTYLISNDGAYLKNNETIEYGNPDSWTYLGYMGDGTIVTVLFGDASEASKWEVLSKKDMEDRMEGATADNPADAFFYLRAHNIEMNDPENLTAWTYTRSGEKAEPQQPWKGWQGWDGQGDDWWNRSTYLWCVNEADGDYVPAEGTDVLEQNVMMAKRGFYEATYRIANQSNTPLVIKLNDTEAKAWEDTEEDMWYAGTYQALHEHPMKAVFEVGNDRMLNVRMEKTIDPAGQNRFAFKSIRLKYLGYDDPSGVAAAIDENAPIEYFNLQGVRVANPERGIFIKRQGSTATKVVK